MPLFATRFARRSKISLFCTFLACVGTIFPLIPVDNKEPPPLPIQFFVTVFLRIMAAVGYSVLLYTTLVPPTHSWSCAPRFRQILSNRFLQGVGAVSYPSYLIHLRLQEVLHYPNRLGQPEEALDGLTGAEAAAVAGAWRFYAVKLFVVSAVISLMLAYTFNKAVEKPLAAYLAGKEGKKKVV